MGIRKKIVGILIDHFFAAGIPKVAVEEANYLLRKGFDVRLLYLVNKHYAYRYQDLLHPKVEVINLGASLPGLFSKSIGIPPFHFLDVQHFTNALFARRSTRHLDLDILIAHGSTIAIAGLAIQKAKKIPLMTFLWDPMSYILRKVYGPTWLKAFFPLLGAVVTRVEKKIIDRSNELLIGSKAHSAFIETQYKTKKYRVVYPGCYPIAESKLCTEKADYFAAFSHWDHDKNPCFLLDMLTAVPQAKMVMTGKWIMEHELEEYRELIRTKGLSDRVTLLRQVEEKELRNITAEALFWIHPNFEAFGMGGLEAAACGCPIMIPRGSGVTDLFQDGVHGYFPRNWNVEEVAKRVEYLYENREEAAQMGRNAWSRACSHSWEHHGEEIYGLVREYI